MAGRAELVADLVADVADPAADRADLAVKVRRFAAVRWTLARLAWPGLTWPGLACPGPGRRRCGLGHSAICRESTSFCYAKIDLGAPRLAWPGLAWPALAWPAPAWPGLAPGKVALVPGFWRHSWELALENAAVSQVLAESAREVRRFTVVKWTLARESAILSPTLAEKGDLAREAHKKPPRAMVGLDVLQAEGSN